MSEFPPDLLHGQRAFDSPLAGLAGGWRLRIPAGHSRMDIITPPHHLVHLVKDGSYSLRISGEPYSVKEGDLIYYPASASVDWLHNEEAVEFLSVCFQAPSWTYDGESHVLPNRRKLSAEFERIVDLCQGGQSALSTQLLACQGMLGIMAELQRKAEPRDLQDTSLSSLWWELEAYVRKNQDWHMPVEAMADLVKRSRSTIHRACQEATGTSPADRIRSLRLDQARDLLVHSPQTISSIAETLGYNRLQEFSREFSTRMGVAPSTYRQEGDA